MNLSHPQSNSQSLIKPFGTLQAPVPHWFFRYKIYHLLFWLIYHYTWGIVNGGKPIEMLNFIFLSPKFLFYVLFQAFAVYFNLYFLIPRFLEKGKYWTYLFLLVVTVFCASSLIVTGYLLTAYLKQTTLLELFGNADVSFFFLRYTLPSTLASMTLAMSIKLAKNWIQAKRREQLLEKEKLETELKFLRSQFNPHFLFNTINSIFVLIHKNPDMASEALAKFSELLRYQLYECNENEIPLRQELAYLENYIELEKLRQDTRNLRIDLNMDYGNSQDLSIAPFILIPFIENAFKHVSHSTHEANRIEMDLSFLHNVLHFRVSNSILTRDVTPTLLSPGGIGLKNVQRRLNLIYPNQHKLDIKQDNNLFTVQLEVTLREHKVAEPVLSLVNH